MVDKVILSIKGGGIRGLIPAVFLAEVEKTIGHSIAEKVDLLAGTSTGGIVAIGLSHLATGGPICSAQQLVDLYMNHGPEIFQRNFAHRARTWNGLIDEKYPSRGLTKAAGDLLGDKTLDDISSNLFVTAYETQQRRPFFLGTKSVRKGHDRPSGLFAEDQNFSLIDAVRATSAAPTYFEAALVQALGSALDEYSLIDGGIFANDPAMLAYVTAATLFPGESSHVISLGTGYTQRPYFHEKVKDWGLVEWARPVLAMMMDGVADTVDQQLKTLLGKNFIGVDINLKSSGRSNPAPSDDMDDASRENLERLHQRGELLVELSKGDGSFEKIVQLLS